jgi:Hypothetical protein (DUF2513)
MSFIIYILQVIRMKRDMGLIRALLLKLEALPMQRGGIVVVSPDDEVVAVDGYNVDQIDYHLGQILQAGFIDDANYRPMKGIGFRCLTPKGHDFVDTVRDPTVWDKTNKAAKQAGAGTIEFFWGIAKEIAKAEIKRHTGFDLQ